MNKWNDKPLAFVIFWGCMSVLINYVYAALIFFMELWFQIEVDKTGASKHSVLFNFIIFCLAAPIIETYLFQKMFYDYFKKRNWNNALLISISSIAFGLFHFYSIGYIIVAAINGILFIYTYIIWQEHKISKYLIVTMIHAFHNLFFLLLEIISS